jgi:hypothetical protein
MRFRMNWRFIRTLPGRNFTYYAEHLFQGSGGIGKARDADAQYALSSLLNQRGDLVRSHNLGPDGLAHQGGLLKVEPVTAGEKWLLSKWIRSDRYPQRLAWQMFTSACASLLKFVCVSLQKRRIGKRHSDIDRLEAPAGGRPHVGVAVDV